MAGARVIISKKNGIPLEKEIMNFVLPLSERQLFVLSEETVVEIRERIKRSITREGSTGKLASSFIAEKIAEGYGVGNIDYLNLNAPYWHWINYGIAQSGRTVPPMTIGHFEGIPEKPSSSSLGDQRWIHESDKQGYLMIPTKPINAHNFIEQTVVRIPEMANNVLNMVK